VPRQISSPRLDQDAPRRRRRSSVGAKSSGGSGWHSTFDGQAWTSNVKIDGQLSRRPVALAAYNGQLHMVHSGNDSNDLWHSTFDRQGWNRNVKIEGQLSRRSPALAAHGGLLHMVHSGDDSNSLWHSTYNGTR
jgi:hypothetical protein